LRALRFIQKNPGILFSFVLIVVLPLFLFVSVSFVVKSFQENIDLILQRKALIVSEVFSLYLGEHYKEYDHIQLAIDRILEDNPEVMEAKVYIKENGNQFRLIEQNEQKVIQKETDTAVLLAWEKEQAIAFLDKKGFVRFWNVVTPFYTPQGEKIGLVRIAMSLKEPDELIYQNLKKTYLFLTLGIILILILVIQHTRLFQYVDLFKKIRELDRAKDSFINMAVHELRAPVVNIRNYAQDLLEEIKNKLTLEEQEELKRIIVSSQRLNELISDILDVVRIEQGRLSFVPQKIVLKDIVKEVVQELESKARQKGLALYIVEQKGSDAQLFVNPNRLKEVLFNLIDNAIKYTPKGEVKVICGADLVKRKGYISVEDTGIGISAQDQAKIFERFYRVKSRETADIPGTGLGLWIVKELVKRMKGEILVESIKGVGSRFTVILPLAKES